MVVRGWARSIATAIGAAACAGAAQLGFGYGLGIIEWLPSGDATAEAAWVASLTWTAWVAATATVAGAIFANRRAGADDHRSRPRAATGLDRPADRVDRPGDRVGGPADRVGHPRHAPVTTAMWRIALAVAAAVGAAVTVLLVAVPAQSAQRADTFSPQTIAGGCAVAGIILGLLVAVWALASPAVATNVTATAGWMWLLAVVSVVDRLVSGDRIAGTKLGVWQWTPDTERFWFGAIYWPGALLTLAAALTIGALAALPAARRGDNRVGVAVSGALGPILIAAAYFVAAPRFVGVQGEQASAYLLAPYAVIAGLAGSVLVAAISQRSRRAGAPDDDAGPDAGVAPVPGPASGGTAAAATPAPDHPPVAVPAGRSGSTAAGAKRPPAAVPAARQAPTQQAPTQQAATRRAATPQTASSPAAGRPAPTASAPDSGSGPVVGLSSPDPDNDPPWIGAAAGHNPYPDAEGGAEPTPARGQASVTRPRRPEPATGDRPAADRPAVDAKPRRPARRSSTT